MGQFSLHAPVPTDAEAWVSKPVKPRLKNGCLVYELYGNVTTSCIIRRQLFDRGLKVHNIPNPNSDIKLPDDGRLSGEVKSMQYWVAYSDQYYVRNVGHEAAEIESNPDYYQPNYKAKSMVGLDELQRRLDLQKQLSRVERVSVLFPHDPVLGELAPKGVRHLEPRYWSMFDSQTPDIESVELIHSLVRLLKPESVLETGGWRGYTTAAISSALSLNGFGKLTSIEEDANAFAYLSERVKQLALPNVQLRHDKSERFTTDERYDFVLFNSSYEDPNEEFYHILPFLKDGATLVFTNSRHDAHFIDSLPKSYERMRLISGQHYPTPRGLYVGTYRQHKPPATRRMIIGLSSGRSGTNYLTSLVKGLPGLIALHEPEPKYQWQTLALQKNPAHAHTFVSGPKKSWIDALPAGTYFEASHYLAKGFLEAWLECGVTPDAVIMERDPRQVASSWYSLNVDFTGNPTFPLQHMLHPDDQRPLHLAITDWQSLHNYQLCYWYALEARKRNEYYASLIESKGGKIFRTSLENMKKTNDLLPFMEWLGVKADRHMLDILKRRSQQRVNDKNQYKTRSRIQELKELDLDTLEAGLKSHCDLT
jgi:hypothetical protein